MRAVGVATLNANSVKKQSINAKSEPSKCSELAISRRRQNYAKNSGRKARNGHICEDSLAYASYSSKDIVQGASVTKNKQCDCAALLNYFIHLFITI